MRLIEREDDELLRAPGRFSRGAGEPLLVADHVERARLAGVRASGESDLGTAVVRQLIEAMRVQEVGRGAEWILLHHVNVAACFENRA